MENARSKPSKQYIQLPKSIKRNLDPEDPDSINKIISQLELEMFEAAKDLRFEEAAKIRDEIKAIKDFNFGINFVETGKRMAN